MRPGTWPRLLLLAAAVAAAVGAGFVSVRRSGEQLAVLEACEAARTGDWPAALARSQERVGADEAGRAAAECRCRALLATGRGEECVDLLEEVLARPEADGWTPGPELAVHLIQTRREAGRGREAAELARRAARRHPEDPGLFYLELITRSAHEDEERVLDELEGRVGGRGPAAARMRVSLANRHLLRGAPERAVAVLGEAPPPAAGEATGPWFETRGMALAQAGDLAGLERSYTRWRASGGDTEQLEARFALTLSLAGLEHPGLSTVERLRRAAERELADPRLAETVAIRLILSLANEGRSDEAIAAYDRARRRFALVGLTREELERSAAHRRLETTPPEQRRGTLRFAVGDGDDHRVLLVSPQPDAPVDAAWEAFPVPPSGRLRVERRAGTAPQRWVLRDGPGATLASGTVHPRPGADTEVTVAPGAPRPPARAALSRRPGDGRRRVALLLLDCADWRLIQYLRARGELPVLSELLARGHHAVLLSDPPLTAAAMEALVWPERSGDASFVGLLHRLGVELGGLASVGENPFAPLSWLLPEASDLFSVIGAGPHSAANLLFAHGGIRAGRHSEVTGPEGRRRRIPLATSARDLDQGERRRFPDLAALRRERDMVHLRTIAAELDVAEQLVRDGEVDLLALRVEPLDILTHAHFAEAVREGQDDGRGLLFSVYRYLDARLAGVHDLLDEDDVFIVMSDHGIRTAMEHSRFAFYVATGAGVPRGRVPGTPELRGVPRALASIFGVETAWPESGLAPWASALASAPRLAREARAPHPAPANR